MSRAICKNVETINLGDFTSRGNRYFTSRSRGTDISRMLDLGVLAARCNRIIIKFPEDLSGINSLFLEEFLEPVMHYLSDDKTFKKLIQIENHSLYNIEGLVEKAVSTLEQKKELHKEVA